MRVLTFCAGALVAVGMTRAGARAQNDPPPLHTENGIRDRLTVEAAETLLRGIDRKTDEAPAPGGRYSYHRFLIGNTLHGSQARTLDNHFLDAFQCLTAANPWDNLANAGALHAFDMRQEPLTYHHRSGPIGAIYSELRTRKNGADAKAPVAVLGMTAGEEACYALKGQTMTFYEADPAVKRLVADTDKYFSYVTDARRRGAEIEIRVGDRRAKLKEDKERKYALIVVDIAESFPIPTDTLTKEAVQEYFDRLTDDGIVALHISNKYLRLEPMVARIAEELKLTARLWNDDAERFPGKTASSWVVLARGRTALGERLCSPISDLMNEHDFRDHLLDVMLRTYPELKGVLAKPPADMQQATLLSWLDKRAADPQAAQFAKWVRKHGSEYVTLMEVLKGETGCGFRPMATSHGVTAWTDGRANVLILWMNPEVQAVRKALGLPTPIDR